jgi:hypothetical protein
VCYDQAEFRYLFVNFHLQRQVYSIDFNLPGQKIRFQVSKVLKYSNLVFNLSRFLIDGFQKYHQIVFDLSMEFSLKYLPIPIRLSAY